MVFTDLGKGQMAGQLGQGVAGELTYADVFQGISNAIFS